VCYYNNGKEVNKMIKFAVTPVEVYREQCMGHCVGCKAYPLCGQLVPITVKITKS